MDNTPVDAVSDQIDSLLDAGRITEADAVLRSLPAGEVVQVLARHDTANRAKLYRLLPRELALEVFDRLDVEPRTELFNGLRNEEVVAFFEEMDPDDRARLVDELPAGVARTLMRGLSPAERALTTPMLGYPSKSIGRYMSTEYVRVLPTTRVSEALAKVEAMADAAETIYLLPVTDPSRLLLGVVSLRRLIASDPDAVVGDVMSTPVFVHGASDAEEAARRALREGFLALPVVDAEQRLIGILTADDAYEILDRADDEDSARTGGAEPLSRPYLATPVREIVRSRIVWLFVLALSATLTVRVIDAFESSLSQVVTLALFIPLLIGTGGNAGAQAATTVTRALAVGEVRPGDVAKVFWREFRVGALMGLGLGVVGFALAGLVFGLDFGLVIGLTLLSICTTAATVGGLMPLLAKALRADPAVFSSPFIATFVDATGLIIYFTIATLVFGL